MMFFFFFSSRRRHTRSLCDWSSDVCSSDLQRPALAGAACFHATAEGEIEDIRRLGFRQPIALIPNAVDVPAKMGKSSHEARTLLFLGRIHHTKGVDILLHAWAHVMGRFPEWRLTIVGTDAAYGGAGYLKEMKSLAHTLDLKRTELLDPAYGDE